jgi:predicted nucleic acid-binding protein
MTNLIILDTGPLVAYLNLNDKYHGWAKKRFQEIVSPLLTCQAVISEACFLTRNSPQGRETILEMIERNLIQTEFNLNLEAKALKHLIHKYQSVPMSLADACLVRMAELYEDAKILTIDKDFTIYRKNKKSTLACITPFDH